MNTQNLKSNHVLNLRHAPIHDLKIGIIGIGQRGLATLKRYMQLELDGFEIAAFSDLEQANIDQAQELLKKHQQKPARTYCSTTGWKLLCEQEDLNLIIICTDWLSHAPMAVYAMEQGKHVAIEVPAAMTVNDCWRLVETAEKTRRHCTMLENCCYDPFALATLNMAQQNAFGEISHVEGAYIHDLRETYFSNTHKIDPHKNWSLEHTLKHTGNPYPTHGLGPLCKVLDIHRTDRMTNLVSMSSHQNGLRDYAIEHFGGDSPLAKLNYKLGDMNTTLIETQKGRTIMLQYSTSMPRPYNRIHAISGTKAYAQKYPIETILLDGDQEFESSDRTTAYYLNKFQHPFVKEIGLPAKQRGIDNIMNYMMDYRLIYCLRNGLALDIDVYDAVEWSCIAELTEKSVLNGSIPIKIPNFLA